MWQLDKIAWKASRNLSGLYKVAQLLDVSKVASIKATLPRNLKGLQFVEHATEHGIRPARSYNTTLESCKEIKPRNAKEILIVCL